METITVRLQLPEGVHVSTREYERSHGHPENVYGSWALQYEGNPGPAMEGLDADGILWHCGTLAEVIEDLPEGEWRLLP